MIKKEYSFYTNFANILTSIKAISEAQALIEAQKQIFMALRQA